MASDVEVADVELEIEIDEDDLQDYFDALINPDEFYAKQAFRVIYQTNNFLLPQVKNLINEKQVINIRPEYQRRLRWKNPQKSKLIESLLLNIPIPSVFFYESEAARYEVMDGQQRLNAIKEFMNNEFKLSSLSILWPLNGYIYSQLPPRVKRGLDRAVITAIVLLLESDVDTVQGKDNTQADIRRFIFERLNTGGTRLNAQELRNAIYPGPFNDLVIELTREPLFTEIWGIPEYSQSDPSEYYENPARQRNTLYSSMMDCRIVLRFFALRDEANVRGAMKDILDRTMEANAMIGPEEKEAFRSLYLERLAFAHYLYGGEPFRLPEDAKGNRRLSIALYDAVMVAIDQLWHQKTALEARRAAIQQETLTLLKDDERLTVLTGQGNTANAIRDRITLMRDLMMPG